MYVLDFSAPNWLINYYHSIGFVSVLLNSFGIYLLQFHCKKLGTFRYWLLSYQVICFATDFHFTFLTQPVPLFPLFGGFTVGYLSEWFDVPAYYLLAILYHLIAVQFAVLVLSFVKKHRSLATLTNGFKFPKLVDPIYFFLYNISFICAVVICDSARLSPYDQLEYIRKTAPEFLAGFQLLKYVEIFVKSQTMFYLIYFLFFLAAILIAPFAYTVVAIFKSMDHLKQNISPITYRKHSEAVRCLVVQITTACFAMAPLLLVGAAVMLEYRYAQFVSELCVAWFASHSSFNMVSLLLFFPPFKTYLNQRLVPFLSYPGKVREQVSAITVHIM